MGPCVVSSTYDAKQMTHCCDMIQMGAMVGFRNLLGGVNLGDMRLDKLHLPIQLMHRGLHNLKVNQIGSNPLDLASRLFTRIADS